MALPDSKKLLNPPALGVARARIPGFNRLSASEQLRAAALALNRDLGVASTHLRLAAKALVSSPDEAWIAYTTHAEAGNSLLSTEVFNALDTGKTYWVGAPGGYIIGAQGAAAVEASGDSDDAGLPPIVATMLSPRVGSAPPAHDCVLVQRDRSLLSDDRLALWQAASGVAMIDGKFPVGEETRLVAAPSLQTVARATTLDSALRYAAVAGVMCALIAGAKIAMLPSVGASGTALKQPAPGALLERIATVAPDVLARTQSATYASGAWVFSLSDALSAPAQLSMQRARFASSSDGCANATRSGVSRAMKLPVNTAMNRLQLRRIAYGAVLIASVLATFFLLRTHTEREAKLHDAAVRNAWQTEASPEQ